MNDFPVDIESVGNFGYTHWTDSFQWPVSYSWILDAEMQIKSALTGLIGECDELEADLLVINYKLFLKYLRLLHCLKIEQWIYESNLTLSCAIDSVAFGGIKYQGFPRLPIMSVAMPEHLNQGHRIEHKLRIAKRSLRANKGFLQKCRGIVGKTTHFVSSAMSEVMAEYLKTKCNNSIAVKGRHEWYAVSQLESLTLREKEQISLLAEKLIARIKPIFEEQNIFLNKEQGRYLFESTKNLFYSSMSHLKTLKRSIQKTAPNSIILGSGGNLFNRMLSVAARSFGVNVIGFIHGEPIIYDWDKYGFLELSTVDTFLTYTNESANILRGVLDRFPPLNDNRVKIEGAETHIFQRIWVSERQKTIPRRIKTVMLVPSAFAKNSMVGQGLAFPELTQLDWEIRIINALKKTGCKIIYKTHPDGKLGGQIDPKIFGNITVVNGRFEDLLDSADAFVFYHTRSTTLGTALCTNKPIIYIDGGWEKWLPEMREPFARRCHIVPARFDERNRLVFDEEELREAVARRPQQPDEEFVRRFMMPSDDKV